MLIGRENPRYTPYLYYHLLRLPESLTESGAAPHGGHAGCCCAFLPGCGLRQSMLQPIFLARLHSLLLNFPFISFVAGLKQLQWFPSAKSPHLKHLCLLAHGPHFLDMMSISNMESALVTWSTPCSPSSMNESPTLRCQLQPLASPLLIHPLGIL